MILTTELEVPGLGLRWGFSQSTAYAGHQVCTFCSSSLSLCNMFACGRGHLFVWRTEDTLRFIPWMLLTFYFILIYFILFYLIFWHCVSYWSVTCCVNMDVPKSPSLWNALWNGDNNCVPVDMAFFFFLNISCRDWTQVLILVCKTLHWLKYHPQSSLLMLWTNSPMLACRGCKPLHSKK